MIPTVPELPIEVRAVEQDEWILAAGPTFGLVDVRIVWPVGASTDGERAGLSALTWDMIERGTRERSRVEFHAALERLGASLHLRMHRQSAQVGLRVLEEYLEPALDLVAEALLSPADDAEEFDELLAETEEGIELSLESPDGAVSRWVPRASWSQAPWCHSIDGLAATRAAITRIGADF